jgi:protease-4
MRFLGKVWRVLVGVKDGLVLILMLLFFGMLFAALSASPYSGSAREGALVLKLDGSIVEQPAEPDTFGSLTGGSSVTREFRLRDVIHALKTAAADGRVKAVVLDLDTFTGGGQSAMSEVASAINVVRRANKPVLAYATAYSDDSYHLASHASEVWLNPMGGVLIAGRGGVGLYFKGLLDKLGVTANVYRVGTFKAAVEPFIRTDMSPEARQASQALADTLWQQWVDDVQRARPKAQVASYALAPVERFAATGGDMAKAAVAAGLVDKLGDRTAFGERLREIVDTDDKSLPGSYRGIRYEAWLQDNPAATAGGNIGILTVAGEIVDGDAKVGTAGAETIVRALEKGLAKNDLKALVVRVDSPGGSVLASERIRQAVLQAKSRGLPVVISMGSLAASGGYWIATPGERIFAEPETITGSIGVFGILPSFEGSMQKLGLGADGVRTTPLSGEPDVFRGFSPTVDRLIQMSVEHSYRQFINLVASSRKMTPQRVDEIAQGRVWDGGTARQLGLVDEFGSLDTAVAFAAKRAGIDSGSANLVYLEKEPDYWARMLAGFANNDDQRTAGGLDAFSRISGRPEQMMMRGLHDARRILSGPALQARCLQCPATNVPLRSSEQASVKSWIAGLIGR